MKSIQLIKKTLFKRRFLPYTILIVAAAAAFTLVALNDHKKTTVIIPSTNPLTSSGAKPTATPPAGSQPSSGSSNAGSSDKSQAAPAGGASNGSLKTPYGNFVSNHSPGQNGSSTSEASTCITTPGASCYIKLTLGNQTKLLETRIADSSGTAYWQWDVGNPSMSSGNWTVTAFTSLNGETKSSQDPRPLVIQ